MKFFAILLTLFGSVYGFAQTESVATTSANEGKTTSVTQVDSDSGAERSAFGVNFFSLGGLGFDQFDDADPSIYFFENFLSGSYRASRNLKLEARYSFTYSTEGVDKFGEQVTNKLENSDFSFIVGISRVLEDSLPASMELKIKPRLYIPTSDKAKEQGLITALRLDTELKYFIDRYSNIRAYVQPQYYFQRSTAYLDQNGKIKTTDMMRSKHGAELSWNLNKSFSLKPGFEIEDAWSNTSSVNDRDEYRKTTIDYRAGIEFRATRDLNFTLGYSNKLDLLKVGDSERGMTLMTNATLY